MELDLVTALTAVNITVLQPSHIQQEDRASGRPLLVCKTNQWSVCINYYHICMFASSFHNTSLHNTCTSLHNIQFISFVSSTILSSQAKYARVIFLNTYENKATEIFMPCKHQPTKEILVQTFVLVWHTVCYCKNVVYTALTL